MSVTYVKFCPLCKSPTALDTAICRQCGHQFRSHLVPPVSEKTVSMQSPIAALPPAVLSAPAVRPTRRALPRIPRPLLALVLGVLALILLISSAVRHALHRSAAPAHTDAPSASSAGPPYDIVFQSTSSQRMAPVATQTDKDLTEWLHLQNQSGGDKNASGDYPETVRLYLSGRILLIAAGTSGRVLEERGDYRQVKILDGLHEGSTGFVAQDSVRRIGQVNSSSGQVLTIP